MRALQDVKQSGLKTTLLVDPVDDFAIGGVAGDGFAQELADAGVVVGFDTSQGRCYSLEDMILGMRGGCDVIPDMQLFIKFFARA